MVLSVTVKVYPDVPWTLGFLKFSGAPSEAHWQAIAAYNAIIPDLVNSQAFVWAIYDNVSFSLNPLTVINKTDVELTALIRPLLDSLDDLNIQYNLSVQSGLRYIDALKITGEPLFTVGNALIGGRMLPRALWANESGIASVLDASREIVDAGLSLFDFSFRLPTPPDGDAPNAVLPAWRTTQRIAFPWL